MDGGPHPAAAGCSPESGSREATRSGGGGTRRSLSLAKRPHGALRSTRNQQLVTRKAGPLAAKTRASKPTGPDQKPPLWIRVTPRRATPGFSLPEFRTPRSAGPRSYPPGVQRDVYSTRSKPGVGHTSKNTEPLSTTNRSPDQREVLAPTNSLSAVLGSPSAASRDHSGSVKRTLCPRATGSTGRHHRLAY